MPGWGKLLERAIAAIDALDQRGTPLPYWALGGGTALMLRYEHRDSKDIDIFIPDPQYLGLLSPRLNDALALGANDYTEAAHYLKLAYDEGAIDIVVSGKISRAPDRPFSFQGREILLEASSEIIFKKLNNRAAGLKPRDIFDTAVVLTTEKNEIHQQLDILRPVRSTLDQRLSTMSQTYYRETIERLGIFPQWEPLKETAFSTVRDLVNMIPAPEPP